MALIADTRGTSAWLCPAACEWKLMLRGHTRDHFAVTVTLCEAISSTQPSPSALRHIATYGQSDPMDDRNSMTALSRLARM